LPEELADEPKIVWEVPLGKSGLGGSAATDDRVFFGDRDFGDFNDLYRCLDAATGKQIWQIQQLAVGKLDYGNSPRCSAGGWRPCHFLRRYGRRNMCGCIPTQHLLEIGSKSETNQG